jgi:hypothetical protein
MMKNNIATKGERKWEKRTGEKITELDSYGLV